MFLIVPLSFFGLQVSTSSPLMSTKKRKEISIKDKENTLSRVNNYLQGGDETGIGFKEPFSKTQTHFTEENHSRQSSKRYIILSSFLLIDI